MVCLGASCLRRDKCKKYIGNNVNDTPEQVEDFSRWGSGLATSTSVEFNYACGDAGHYAMFEALPEAFSADFSLTATGVFSEGYRLEKDVVREILSAIMEKSHIVKDILVISREEIENIAREYGIDFEFPGVD